MRTVCSKILVSALLMAGGAGSCGLLDNTDGGEGYIVLHFSEDSYKDTRASSYGEIPDTIDFLLDIRYSKGNIIYSGTFGDSPEKLPVDAGTYNISVRSGTFEKPEFASPQYGDDQCITVPSGGVVDVWLTCGQINSGVKLIIDRNFLTVHPDGVLFLKSEDGKLMYSYSEKRIAYFNPGNVSLMMSEGGTDKILFTRVLKAREILSVSLTVPPASATGESGGIHIQVDTSRSWSGEEFIIGGPGSGNPGSGSDIDCAMNVSQAKENIGAEDVWVYGYIVGGDLTSSGISFSAPFKSETNIAIAARTTVSEKSSCLSVQLAKGDARDTLNLVSNPSNLKRKVYLKGDIVEAYYGIPGLKNISDFVLE